jgi:hypothetical protein
VRERVWFTRLLHALVECPHDPPLLSRLSKRGDVLKRPIAKLIRACTVGLQDDGKAEHFE